MKIAVLKLSGKALDSFCRNDQWLQAMRRLRDHYEGVAVVHGAGEEISQWLKIFGHESEFIDGQRVTTSETIPVISAVQSGFMNGKIVNRLVSNAFDAIGLTGMDRGLFVAKSIRPELGLVGVPRLNGSVHWLIECLEEAVVPVFSTICRNEAGDIVNVNADIFAAELARSLQADSVFFVSDIPGVRIGGSVVPYLNKSEIQKKINEKQITGGMIPKVESCLELLEAGVNKAWIGPSDPQSLMNLFEENAPSGTWIVTEGNAVYA